MLIHYAHLFTCFFRVRVLDLCSSWVSHIPPGAPVSAVSGLGMNAEELRRNPLLSDRVVLDLNTGPEVLLPFQTEEFHAVLLQLSMWEATYLQPSYFMWLSRSYFTVVKLLISPSPVITSPIPWMSWEKSLGFWSPTDCWSSGHSLSCLCIQYHIYDNQLRFMNSFSNRVFIDKAVSLWTGKSDLDHIETVGSYLVCASSSFKTANAVTTNEKKLSFDIASIRSCDVYYEVLPLRSRGSYRNDHKDPLYAVSARKGQ